MPKERTELTELELEELEARRLQNELAREQIETLRAEREMKKGRKERGKRDAEKAIADLKAMQDRCNHRTGGAGAEAIAFGQGDEKRPTCIGAQVFLDDRVRLTCQRCRAECWSDEKNREKWAYWVGLWKQSINQQMMVVGGLKVKRAPELTV